MIIHKADIRRGRQRTLPVVLSREEASRLIEGARTLKHQAVLSVAHGAGLRVSEVVALKVGDIDGQRMLLRIEKGKGQKDRYALLPPIMLERLRTWWRYARAEGKVLPGGYLLPGLDPMDSLRTRQLNRARTSAPSKFCLATKNWRPQRSILRSPPRPCARS